MKLEEFIKDVPDFPKKGILFKDITPILQDSQAYEYVVKEIADYGNNLGANVVVGPESRGFIFGCPAAIKMNRGFVPVRKPGKLPRETVQESYALEYGFDTLEMHKDALGEGDKVLIVDDLLATGGTLEAITKMVNKLGAEVVGIFTVIELVDLKGREKLKDYNVKSLLKY